MVSKSPKRENPLSEALSMDMKEEVYEYFGSPRGSTDIQDVMMSVTSSADQTNAARMDSFRERKVRRQHGGRKQSDTMPFVRANLALTKGNWG